MYVFVCPNALKFLQIDDKLEKKTITSKNRTNLYQGSQQKMLKKVLI